MQMPYNNQTIFELLDTYKEKALELAAILDINLIEKPHYYKVVFQDTDTKKDLPPVHIPPELLRYRYRVGNVYHDGRVVRNSMPNIYQFEIENDDSKVIEEVSNFLDETDIGFINERNKKYFLGQMCYHFSYEEYEVIVPCYTIANRYLFLSSSMKKAVFDGSLESLFYEGTHKKIGGEVYLEVKHTIAKRDILYLCRFLDDDKYAFNKFTYIANQKNAVKDKTKPFKPIKAKFLTKEKFMIHCTARTIIKNDKPIYFVTNIMNDTSTLNFDYVKYKKYSSKGPKPENDEAIKVKKPTIIRTIPKQTTGRVEVGTAPSSQYTHHGTVDYVEPDLNREGITVEEVKAYKDADTNVSFDNSDNTVNKGFEPSSQLGDEGTRPNSHSIADNEEEVEKSIFEFSNFTLLYNGLIQEEGVVHKDFSEPTTLKVRKNDSGHTPSRYFLADNKTVRRFYYGTFYYDSKQVFVVEIELDSRWSNLSTWFLVSDDLDLELSEGDFQYIISKYMKDYRTYNVFINFLYDSYRLKFIPKKHQDVYNEESILTWTESVLHKIEEI